MIMKDNSINARLSELQATLCRHVERIRTSGMVPDPHNTAITELLAHLTHYAPILLFVRQAGGTTEAGVRWEWSATPTLDLFEVNRSKDMAIATIRIAPSDTTTITTYTIDPKGKVIVMQEGLD